MSKTRRVVISVASWFYARSRLACGATLVRIWTAVRGLSALCGCQRLTPLDSRAPQFSQQAVQHEQHLLG